MIRSTRLLLVLAIAGCSGAHAARLSAPVVVPFELRGDYALLTVAVNGHPTLLILDSGSGALVLDSAFAAEAKIDWSWFLRGKADGNTQTSVRIGKADSVRIGTAAMSHVRVAAVDLHDVRQKIGYDVHGALGYEAFEQFVVAIDYQAKTLTLSDLGSFEYRGSGTIVPLTFDRRLPVVDASIVTRTRGTIPARLHLDLGSANYAVRLASRFVLEHHIDQDTTTVTGILGTGVGGTLQGRLLRLPQLRIGTLQINQPSTALSSAKDGAFGMTAATDGTIGVPVLRRSRLTLDYSRSRAIIEPLANFGEADSVDGSGLTLLRDSEKSSSVRVAYVVKGSAANAAGIMVGDEIESIDGVLSAASSLQSFRDSLRQSGRVSHVVVRRDGRRIEAELRLRMVI